MIIVIVNIFNIIITFSKLLSYQGELQCSISWVDYKIYLNQSLREAKRTNKLNPNIHSQRLIRCPFNYLLLWRELRSLTPMACSCSGLAAQRIEQQ